MLANPIEIKWDWFKILIKNAKKLEPLINPLENYLNPGDIMVIKDIKNLMVDCFAEELFEKGEIHVRK